MTRTTIDLQEAISRSTVDDSCAHHAPCSADQLSVDAVLRLLQELPTWSTRQGTSPGRRLRGASRVLGWLERWPGTGWQERWVAVGGDQGLEWIDHLAAEDPRSEDINSLELRMGVNWLFLARVMRPAYSYFPRSKSPFLFEHAPRLISPDLFEHLAQEAAASPITCREHTLARRALVKLALHTGKEVEQLSVEDMLEFRDWANRNRKANRGLGTAWDLLRRAGVISANGSLLETTRRGGQRPISELVDSYGVRSSTIREVLIRYLEERRASLDYNSVRSLASHLVGLFWVDIETHHPGIDSLELTEDIAQAWKQRLLVVRTKNGQTRPRKTRLETLTKVRAFYLDIQEWAHTDPAWVPWAVPSPVRRGDTDGILKARQQTTARMHQRVRERLPQLLVLVETAEKHRDSQRAFLEEARQTPAGGALAHDGQRYRRVVPKQQPGGERYRGPDTVLVENIDTGIRIDVTQTEDEAFWAWGLIETLRHTGVRLEELLEITHLALNSYQLPETGELVPLLQIVPSKSNEERLLLISPELASVLATIISRLRRDHGGTVPLVARYDPHERITGPPLPHLFQRKNAHRWGVMSYNTVRRLLNDTVARTGLRNAAGETLNYTAHDFRRIFATDAVTGGLPVHIAARLLGHHSVATTQSYLAVFQEDLVRAYRSFLDSRRSVRPEAEYREPTEEEWREFQQHFQARKLELGDCGRPYGTGCQHEHACLRCPMLRVAPAQRPRLLTILQNLDDRITEAKMNGWLGEVQGLQYSLAKAKEKLANLDKAISNSTGTLTDLGIPTLRAPL
ncbi:site-specific integrase [Saccharopolyspora sp. 6V]|uniref:tyrosine-type recombinase/integrase n=1 Tax=Saccharopolyspora sp. 6V TaxID=2877239 RepID=UPI001CD61E76|nr:site-specific integrase [Saccharopolyspora sp. 6V]MCA1196299.1 site-specific integrase [Saccharopolyspora sp. 6V]